MNCFLSGYHATNTAVETRLIASGVTHRCYSFSYIESIPSMPPPAKGVQAAYGASVDHNVQIMMDSGVFSYRMYRDKLLRAGKDLKNLPNKDQFTQLYIDFVKKNHKKWAFYLTLDFLTDAKENFIIQQKLIKAGIRPVPVFHGDSTIDYVRRYKEELGADFIGIGGVYRRGFAMAINAPVSAYSATKYLASMFDAGEKYGVKFHGLAITSVSMLLRWPFASCDSSTWSRQAGYGVLMRFDPVKRRINYIHVSTREAKNLNTSYKSNNHAVARLKEELESEGYNFEELQTSHVARHCYNAQAMLKMSAFATKVHRQGVWKSLYA